MTLCVQKSYSRVGLTEKRVFNICSSVLIKLSDSLKCKSLGLDLLPRIDLVQLQLAH